ncbi:unnamed protein product [Ectocarpus fasciculatus]
MASNPLRICVPNHTHTLFSPSKNELQETNSQLGTDMTDHAMISSREAYMKRCDTPRPPPQGIEPKQEDVIDKILSRARFSKPSVVFPFVCGVNWRGKGEHKPLDCEERSSTTLPSRMAHLFHATRGKV